MHRLAARPCQRSGPASSAQSAPCAPNAARRQPACRHVAVRAVSPEAELPKRGARVSESWKTREDGAEDDEDLLAAIGKKQNYNINVDHGQNIEHLDHLYAGGFLGQKSDIASGELRTWDFRSFNNLVGDYYVSPRFAEAIALHIVKNYMASDFDCRVPLILGIWGGKGQGKTFQTELTFKKMGVEPIIMSAGELEDSIAGRPSALIRNRYRRAAEVCKNQGKLSCLVINDIDAGIGRFENTQVTVNNQIVQGCLMNLCDDPETVSVGGTWEATSRGLNRIPIIVTGNDLSTLFAPLIRDGRMEKFYWNPNREEIIATMLQMYRDDHVSEEDLAKLVDAFPGQSMDFFGAVRQATYDEHVYKWVNEQLWDAQEGRVALERLGARLFRDRPLKVDGTRDPVDGFDAPRLTLEQLLEEGQKLIEQQDLVEKHKLSEEYMAYSSNLPGSGSLIGFGG
ncbi:unnamed protein product [Pedinophyceae sp. YPF-701]|nr:unnamed protein product [Pedinophyceae sp. YPF-701]